jgi:hypothetical protein
MVAQDVIGNGVMRGGDKKTDACLSISWITPNYSIPTDRIP